MNLSSRSVIFVVGLWKTTKTLRASLQKYSRTQDLRNYRQQLQLHKWVVLPCRGGTAMKHVPLQSELPVSGTTI